MHLTARALALALVAVVTFIAAQWSNDPDIATLWRAVLMLLAVGLAFEAWAQARISIWLRFMLPAALHLGRETDIGFAVTHDSPRTQRLRLLPVAPEAAPCDASGERELRLAPDTPAAADNAVSSGTLAVRPVRLGVHLWPQIPARLLGPLGLAWWDRPLESGATVRIVPDLLRRSGARMTAPAHGARPRPRQEVAREIHRWHDWQPGDPLSRIDWKVTARSGVLTTRELRDDQHLEMLLVVDAGCDSAAGDGALDALGIRVNLAARLAESALARGDRVGLLAFSDRVLRAAPPMGGAAALPRIRAQLAALVSDPQPGDAGVAARAALRALLRPAGVVLWFGDPEPESLRSVAARHSVVVVMPREPGVEALVDGSPGTPRRFWTALAAERFLTAAHERADSLRQIGVMVVSETPARLEGAVWAAVPRGSRANRRVR
jgi:uncharacterized protein (DUF58 family)